jgi:CheY-like chemotaxis protein
MTKANCIILIDDDPIANFLNQSTIENLNITDELLVFENGLEGIRYLTSLKDNSAPSYIFLDLNMPVMDGFDFMANYNTLTFKDKERTKIIVLTTSSNAKDIEKAKELGCRDYLTKPLTESKIQSMIEKYGLQGVEETTSI